MAISCSSAAVHAMLASLPMLSVRPPADAAPITKPKLHLSWAGSGIFFWWQLGAMQHLMERYDMTQVQLTGVSGGGLVSVLGACQADPVLVMESAYELAVQNNVYERPLGLMGVWGKMIESWLDQLLPDDAAELCSGRVGLIVTRLPSCQRWRISEFSSKADLINVAMASAHVPLFLDAKLTRSCRGTLCVDGSLPDFFTGGQCKLLGRGGDAVVFDYHQDTALARRGRMEMLENKGLSELQHIMKLGYEYADKLHADGLFDRFDLDGLALECRRSLPPAGVQREKAAALTGAVVGQATSGVGSDLEQEADVECIVTFGVEGGEGAMELGDCIPAGQLSLVQVPVGVNP